MKNTRPRYEQAFKLDLVQQVVAGGKSVAEASQLSGVEASTLYNWIRQYKSSVSPENLFPGNGKLSNQDDELRRLRRRVAQLVE
jgi:transposase-like protein